MSTPCIVAPLARRRTQLMEKGNTRPHNLLERRLPAGSSGALCSVPKGKDYRRVEDYCEAMRCTTDTFKVRLVASARPISTLSLCERVRVCENVSGEAHRARGAACAPKGWVGWGAQVGWMGWCV